MRDSVATKGGVGSVVMVRMTYSVHRGVDQSSDPRTSLSRHAPMNRGKTFSRERMF